MFSQQFIVDKSEQMNCSREKEKNQAEQAEKVKVSG
jgi:hypothetical protein